MAALIPNVAKGKFAYYASLPAANDGLVWVLLKAAGLEADALLRDYTTLALLLAGASDEADFPGYGRVIHTANTTVTVDQANDRVDTDDTVDPTWAPTAIQALGKIVCCYDPDTTAGTDADLIPIFMDDFVLSTPLAGAISYAVAAGGFGRSS